MGRLLIGGASPAGVGGGSTLLLESVSRTRSFDPSRRGGWASGQRWPCRSWQAGPRRM